MLAARNEEWGLDDLEFQQVEACRSSKKRRAQGEQEIRAAYGAHAAQAERREASLAQMGICNRTDPLTSVPLEPQKPIALLVNEDSGELTGFDLYSLYHLCLKRGKTWVRSFDGRFRLEPTEVVSMISEFARYYGHV